MLAAEIEHFLGLGNDFKGVRSPAVLLVADLFHPVGGLAVETFHNGDVRHGRGCRGSMPVFLTRRDPDDIPLPDFLDLTAPLLNPAGASRHDQGLAERVAVPRCPGTGLECHAGSTDSGWIRRTQRAGRFARCR